MKGILGALALIALLAPATASPRSTGTLYLHAFFSSPNVPTVCTPPATSCKALRASASVRGLGNVRFEGTLAITDPGFHARASGRLVVANKGSVDFEADNSQTAREVLLALRITGGTGVFTGASGEGTYQMDSRTGTTSLWDVELTAPGYEFDLRPSRVVVSSASGKRRGSSCAIRVAYRADDDRPGPVRVSLSAGTRAVSSTKPAGVLSLTVRRTPRVRLSLLAVDASANTARRSVSVRC